MVQFVPLSQDLLHDSRYSFTGPSVKAHSPLEERKYHPDSDLCGAVKRVLNFIP